MVSLFFAGGESKSVPARELDDRRENKRNAAVLPAAERMGMQMTRKQKYRRVLLALAALFLILAVLLATMPCANPCRIRCMWMRTAKARFSRSRNIRF